MNEVRSTDEDARRTQARLRQILGRINALLHDEDTFCTVNVHDNLRYAARDIQRALEDQDALLSEMIRK